MRRLSVTRMAGRFQVKAEAGLPEQDRAISLREAAILQGFPRDYAFVPDDGEVRFKILGRLIGNAVPVDLGRAIARSIDRHLASVGVLAD